MNYTKSESITSLSKSLVDFHGQMGKVAKDSVNPHFRNKYASLSTIIEAVTPILHGCGLSIIQMPCGSNEITTILLHVSGEYISSTYQMPVQKQNDPQALGSAITYARRYAIGAFLSLNIDEDDDANSASGQSNKQATRQQQQQPQQADDRKWLNMTDKNGNPTPEWEKTLEYIRTGKTTIEKLKVAYKINKDTLAQLEDFVNQLLS
jgi:hypothetical protein